MSKQAYIVKTNEDEDRSVIIFVENLEAAKTKAVDLYDWAIEEINDDTIRRSEELDQYSDLGYAPPKDLILKHGWWWECHHCGQSLDENEDDIDKIVGEKDVVFCNTDCQKSHRSEVERVNKEYEDFKSDMLKKFPDLEFKFAGGYPYFTHSATFEFSGCKYGGSARLDEGKLSMFVNPDDYDLWVKLYPNHGKIASSK